MNVFQTVARDFLKEAATQGVGLNLDANAAQALISYTATLEQFLMLLLKVPNLKALQEELMK